MGRSVTERGPRPLSPSRSPKSDFERLIEQKADTSDFQRLIDMGDNERELNRLIRKPSNRRDPAPRPPRPPRPRPKMRPVNPPPPPRKPPKPFLPGLNSHRAPVRILPGFGPAAIGLSYQLTQMMVHQMYQQITKQNPQPPGWRVTGWEQTAGPYDLAYYRTTEGYLQNPTLKWEQMGDYYPHVVNSFIPGTGVPRFNTNEFFANPARVLGFFSFEVSRERLVPPYDVSAPNTSFYHSRWQKVSAFATATPVPGAAPIPRTPYQPFPNPQLNPNVARTLPAPRPIDGLSPKPWDDPTQSPSPRTKTDPKRYRFDIPLPELEAIAAPDQMPRPKTQTQPERLDPHKRRYRENETKVISAAARIGIKGWGLLDTVSELSEIGGAFFDALPEEVQDLAADCPEAQSIGQYGLAITPCEMEILLEHWTRVDGVEAFKNLAKNAAEDMTIGQFHKFLAKLYPPGISFKRTAITHAMSKAQPELYISQRLNELWEFLGV